MPDRPSRTNLIHIGIMAAVLIGSVVTVALASGGIGSTGTPAATASDSGDTANKPDKTKKADKADKAKSVDVTVTGTLGTRIAADGSTEYTLTSGDTVLLLDAGPAWFFRDAYPARTVCRQAGHDRRRTDRRARPASMS